MSETAIRAINYLAIIAPIYCVIISVRGALRFCFDNTRLFTALSLFALVWAFLVLYYSKADYSELMVAFGGFLLVYVGRILCWEATATCASSRNHQDIKKQSGDMTGSPYGYYYS